MLTGQLKNWPETKKSYAVATTTYSQGSNFPEPSEQDLIRINNSVQQAIDAGFVKDAKVQIKNKFTVWVENSIVVSHTTDPLYCWWGASKPIRCIKVAICKSNSFDKTTQHKYVSIDEIELFHESNDPRKAILEAEVVRAINKGFKVGSVVLFTIKKGNQLVEVKGVIENFLTDLSIAWKGSEEPPFVCTVKYLDGDSSYYVTFPSLKHAE